MPKENGKKLNAFLGAWVTAAGRHAAAVVAAALIFSALVLYYLFTGHLGIITDDANLLSGRLHYLQVQRAFNRAFPQLNDTIVMVIDGQTPDLAIDAREKLAARLVTQKKLFTSVYVPGGEAFFQKNGLLYLSVSDLQSLTDHLATVQPLLAELIRHDNLKGLFDLLSQAVKAHQDGQKIDLQPVFSKIADAAAALLANRFYRLSWIELMNGHALKKASRRQFMIVQTVPDYSSLLPGRRAMHAIRKTVKALHLDSAHGVQVRLTGSVAMAFEEFQSVMRGAKLAGILSFVMVGIVIFIGLRSPKMVLATVITLLVGLIWTAGFAALAVGHLNMISVAFAVLFIGLGVDYAIHFCLRYRELLQSGENPVPAMRQTAESVGSSLVLCAVTTAIGFFAFIPTDFSGVGELGLISGCGMFIGLAATLTLLPALFSVLRFDLPPAPSATAVPDKQSLLGFFCTHAKAVKIGALLAAVGAAILLPQIRFDRNPLDLRNPASESVATFRQLLKQSDNSPWSLKVLAANEAQAESIIRRVKGLKSVKRAICINAFVPPNQSQKLNIIDDLSYIAGPVITEAAPRQKDPGDAARIQALQDFLRRITAKSTLRESHKDPATARLADLLEQLLQRIENADDTAAHHLLRRFEISVLGSLPGRLKALRLSLDASAFGVKDLPHDLLQRWISANGAYRVEIFPRGDMADRDIRINFIQAVRARVPQATGYPVVIYEGGKVVARSFLQAFGYSLAAITLLLLWIMPQKRDAMLVLALLMLAGILTGGCMVILHIPLNFANIIALPLILGIGVDNGIHIVHRFRATGSRTPALLQSSTIRGVVFSALTTVCSFGNLALSPHPGMASMGKLLTIGILASLVCTLVVLPALLQNSRTPDPVAY